jgi:hypothetical protein
MQSRIIPDKYRAAKERLGKRMRAALMPVRNPIRGPGLRSMKPNALTWSSTITAAIT